MCDLQLEDDDAAAKAARTKTFHITTAEGDGDGRWYEIFVRSPIDRAALVGADPDEFEFDQLKKVGTTLRVTIAASYPYKDERGDWQDRTRWNEITIFYDARKEYVQRNIKPGDLVRALGVIEQTSWEKDGETVYGVTLACEQIGRLAKGPNHAESDAQ